MIFNQFTPYFCIKPDCLERPVFLQQFCEGHLDQILLGDKEHMSTKETNPKDPIGIKKPSLTTIPFPVLYEVGAAMLEGACKYRRHNYRVAGVRASVYIEANFRHLADYWEGEDIDKDSGIHHVSKAIASLVVLRDAMMNDMCEDDRPPKSKPDWMGKIQKLVDGVLARYDGKDGRPLPLEPYTQVSQEAYGLFDDPELDEMEFDEGPPTSCDHANKICVNYPNGGYGKDQS